MNKENLVVLSLPNFDWLYHLRKDHLVYLVKEKTFAQVEWTFDPPEPGRICGRIGLRFEGGRLDSWLIRSNGQGINCTQCLLPVEGNLSAEPIKLEPEDIRFLKREIEQLRKMQTQLAERMYLYDTLLGLWTL